MSPDERSSRVPGTLRVLAAVAVVVALATSIPAVIAYRNWSTFAIGLDAADTRQSVRLLQDTLRWMLTSGVALGIAVAAHIAALRLRPGPPAGPR